MILWLVFSLMVVAAILFVVWRVVFPADPKVAPDNDLAANRTLFREKLDQLQAQLAGGEIDEAVFHSLELEYQRQFLADNQQIDPNTAGRGGRLLVAICGLLIPLITVLLYQQLGATTEMRLHHQLEARSGAFRP